MGWQQIPYAGYQGLFHKEQGLFSHDQANLRKAK
jgi:hypothetical protein